MPKNEITIDDTQNEMQTVNDEDWEAAKDLFTFTARPENLQQNLIRQVYEPL